MNLDDNYKIRLIAKNEGIEYVNNSSTYRFNILLRQKEWQLYIPGTVGESYKKYDLTADEEIIIINRI